MIDDLTPRYRLDPGNKRERVMLYVRQDFPSNLFIQLKKQPKFFHGELNQRSDKYFISCF